MIYSCTIRKEFFTQFKVFHYRERVVRISNRDCKGSTEYNRRKNCFPRM